MALVIRNKQMEQASSMARPGDGQRQSFSTKRVLDKRIASYLGLTFGLTWLLAGAGYLLGVTNVQSPAYVVLAALCMLCPGIVAVVQQRVLDKAAWSGLGLSVKGTRWGTVIWTAASGMAIVPLYLLVHYLLGNVLGMQGFGQVSLTSEQVSSALAALGDKAEPLRRLLDGVPGWIVLLGGLVAALFAGVTVNLPFMLGEELGWRGYLWQRTAHWSALARVGVTGCAWGIWHAPLIAMGHNYLGHPVAGIGMMVILCVMMAFLFDWTRSLSGSIWSSCILHGLINGTAGLAVLFTLGGHVLVGSLVGGAGVATLALMVLVVFLFDARYRALLFNRGRSSAEHAAARKQQEAVAG